MTGFDVRPEALRGASPQFDGAADKLQAALDKLNGVLQAEGECWGNDEAGQEFAKDYKPGSQSATDAFTGLTGALHQIRGELDNTAKTWETDDTNNADSFR
ncbi:WXG100 family type VII secretion target [Saccharopolyspora spinosa]|uniref:WXG100 family type VII secretion target n=1 Tax=Saccharopolyspora spinosa TaxID=60894 RepID=A0A2N3XX78_SACSN|nr:WXG100 family type VII secretion target [Saccharopolyspora spinosa]PKW15272.1 WXG100 family type VII secretion target [Saccharopolyspora spinosa]